MNSTPEKFDIPVAAIVFNRPYCARRLMEVLRRRRPSSLFVISDGPRDDRPDEDKLVKECREMMTPDWECQLIPIYSDRNMGCRGRITSGLDEVFSQVDRAIVLEDDCIPVPAFFDYCNEQLERYRDEHRVMSVCGYRTFPENLTSEGLTFCRYSNSWGWATWSRAWVLNRRDLHELIEDDLRGRLYEVFGSRRAALYWEFIFNRVRAGKNDSWAYIWMLSQWLENGLTVYPPRNLVVNHGGDMQATHTKGLPFYLRRKAHEGKCWATREDIDTNQRVDRWLEDIVYSKSIWGRVIWIMDVMTRKFFV